MGWRERTDSDKMRRRQLRQEFLSPPDSESEAESPAQSPPAPKKPVRIVIDETHSDEEDTEAFNKSLDRAPSAKSVSVTPAPAKHRSRVKDKFKPSIVPSSEFSKDREAARLHRALHDSGTDHDTVIEILTSKTHAQRKKISKAYKFNHNKVKIIFFKLVFSHACLSRRI